jgi:beta-lactamase class A
VGLFEQQRAAMAGIARSTTNANPDRMALSDVNDRLVRELAVFEKSSGGTLGVYATNLLDGRCVGYREAESFPMASTFKVSLAMLVLQQIENGVLNPEQMIEIGPDLLVPPPLIEAYFRHPGLIVSVANLLDIMLVTSDNSATDALLSLVGGPGAVMAAIEKAGISGMRVDRSTGDFLKDFLEVVPEASLSFARHFAAQPLSEKARLYGLSEQANAVYEDDVRDSSTPVAMVQLMRLLWEGDALTDTSRQTLFEIMQRCENDSRLKGLLPVEIYVWHKTGTLGGSTSDVGIIDLPYGAGTVAIAVYVKKSSAPTKVRETAIAHVTRTIYDYMLYGAKTHLEEVE